MRETIHVVQAFRRADSGELVADQPEAAKDAAHARERALRLKDRRVGVIAFSRTGDMSIGEYEDAVVLARFGTIPEDEEVD
ncbi:MAG: hypothetical protein J0H94_03740 [Rhizobiales bacterium]|nr:hypothetical protein [Hyphomicrobiales bacterium]